MLSADLALMPDLARVICATGGFATTRLSTLYSLRNKNTEKGRGVIVLSLLSNLVKSTQQRPSKKKHGISVTRQVASAI